MLGYKFEHADYAGRGVIEAIGVGIDFKDGDLAKSIKQILGISGRIVKAGEKIIVAGDLEYGGSKHVATALLSVNKKYSNIQSAINLKYRESTISKIKKMKWNTFDYDRNEEPENIKIKGSTIAWGITNAIRNSKKTPDVIFHKGDFGKEPYGKI